MEEFNKPKIIYSEIVKEPQFYLDNNGKFYPEATTFLMTGKYVDMLYHLLHSKIITYCFKTFYAGGGLNEKGYRYKKKYLENLPIPLNAIKLNITKENVEIVVKHLYNLTDEEVLFIENQ